VSFQNPSLLFLLPVPIALAWVTVRRAGAPVDVPVAPQALRHQRMLVVLLALPALLPPFLIGIVVVLLAGPIRQEQSISRSPKNLTNIQFCLNVSNTMMAGFTGGSRCGCRFCASVRAIGEFAKRREGDAFGLTLIGAEPIVWLPLSDDVSALYHAASFCFPNYMPRLVNRYPDTAAGIRLSIEQLTTRYRDNG
jgi:hypothetical protein